MCEKKINILGTEYEILTQTKSENAKLENCVGLCEQYSKKIIVDKFEDAEKDMMCVENLQEFRKKILRHEIIHAFLGESGLRCNSEWAENEEMIDYFAIQIPKMIKIFEQAGAI